MIQTSWAGTVNKADLQHLWLMLIYWFLTFCVANQTQINDILLHIWLTNNIITFINMWIGYFVKLLVQNNIPITTDISNISVNSNNTY